MRISFVMIILFLCSSTFAQDFPAPDLPEGETLFYKVRCLGKFSDPKNRSIPEARLFWEIEQMFQVETRWVGEGENRHIVSNRTGVLFGGGTSNWTYEFEPGSSLTLHRLEHTVNFPSGKLFHKEAYNLSEPNLKYPKPLFNLLNLDVTLRGLEFIPGRSYTFWHWSTPLTRIMKMEARIIGKEVLELPIGRRECWKIQTIFCPENFKGLGLLGYFLKYIVPKSTFWMLADESHALARSEIRLPSAFGKVVVWVRELSFMRTAENPKGIGEKPEIISSSSFPAMSSDQPFHIPKLSMEEKYRLNVTLDEPVSDESSLHLFQQFVYLESAASIENISRIVKEGDKSWLDFNYITQLRNGNTCNTHIRFLPGEKLQMKDMTIKAMTPSGKVVREEYICLNDPEFGFPPDLLQPYAARLAYQSMDLTPGNSRNFHMLVGIPGGMLKMKITVKEIETLTLNNKDKVNCYRLEMEPILSEFLGIIGKLVQPFVPKYTWWLTEDPPHLFARFRGPIGSGVNIGKTVTENFDRSKFTAK